MEQLDNAYQTGHQKDASAILKHAVEFVPFYKFLKNRPVQLTDFPVVNKVIIKKNQDQFLSSAFDIDTLYKGKTSGSNGVPFHFYWSKHKAQARTAEVIYHNRWLGYKVGDPHLLNAVGSKKNRLTLLLQREYLANPRQISRDWLEGQRTLLKEKRIPFYIGYGSVIERFTRYCHALGDSPTDFSLRGIISTAEHLSEHAQEQAQQLFGCPVIRRYASLETGVLAHECPEFRKFHVNSAGYHIEFLKIDSDQPALPGEVARIVVTDLNAFAMPLIRYDIGDLAVIDPSPCQCGRQGVIIKELMGRRTDNLISQDGKLVSWISVSDIMWSFNHIEGFQIVQEDFSCFSLYIVSQKQYDKKQLENAFRLLLGQSIELQIHDVDSIARPTSGKAPSVLNRIPLGTHIPDELEHQQCSTL